LDQAALNAVRQAHFIPARQGRQAVESRTLLTFRFTLVD
jgi:outer membrane biosynthesis protein TonB